MKKIFILSILLISMVSNAQYRAKYVKTDDQFSIRILGVDEHVFTATTYTGDIVEVNTVNATTLNGNTINLGGSSIATLYAPIAKGVTNGDSHDHNGGDGAQINHTTLSNIGTNTHAAIDTKISDLGLSVYSKSSIPDNTITSVFSINGLSNGECCNVQINYSLLAASGVNAVSHSGIMTLTVIRANGTYAGVITEGIEATAASGPITFTDTWSIVSTGTESTIRLTGNNGLDVSYFGRFYFTKVTTTGTINNL